MQYSVFIYLFILFLFFSLSVQFSVKFLNWLPEETKRQEALHYAVCLLPKVNRDVLEVLLLCLHEVAQCECQDDPEKGSKMNLCSLATVMAPNVIMAPPKIQDDPGAAVQVLYSLLLWQSTFWTVPDQVVWVLRDEALLGNGMAGSYTKELLKRVASTLASRKDSDMCVIHDTDHRASKALIEEESSLPKQTL
ncbi:hypothetical protein HMI55_005039 [Coelomomyces lativittatus]|nr:hypothetical protein HMI55_005039 [Coelomomyces lativittatus]